MTLGTGGLIAVLIAAIVLVVVLIVGLKLHGSIALTIAAITVALVTGVKPAEVGDVLEKGVGGTLGFLVLIIGFGAILGKMLEVSGGAERLAKGMLRVFGEKRAPIVMSFLGLIAGIPVFVEVGFVLLVPLVFVVAREVGCSKIRVGVPLAISLMVVHCILPPHPAATAIAGTLGADIGMVIMLGLIVGIPAALIGGPLYTGIGLRQLERVHVTAGAGQISGVVAEGKPGPESKGTHGDSPAAGGNVLKDDDANRSLPGFGITLLTILLPLIIMVCRTVADQTLPEENGLRQFVDLVGNPILALLISVIFAYFSLGISRGKSLSDLSSVTDSSFAPIGGVLLIIGAGGAFNAVLMASGMDKAIAGAMGSLPVSPLILAWLIAIVLHFAVGSATVAMISAAGIVLPMLQASPDLSPALMAIAVGAGAIGLTHVTDSLFWLYKEYMGISVGDALKTLTVGTTIASVVALCMTMLLHLVI
ncbi:gluconate:H+ symporter (GntP) family transporter [Actinotignum schaalii FB123-CNA-2]|uniref:Gluconate:H+ symporter (GntP) family transporter n=2 Tax=Actinotignum schaalii TaxID=59505 RepID=S2WDQ9_9ACTO|nr:gluconate:H+ symporter (GntP) family transporter [Actinotignum schaalii FB123-CNA-2]